MENCESTDRCFRNERRYVRFRIDPVKDVRTSETSARYTVSGVTRAMDEEDEEDVAPDDGGCRKTRKISATEDGSMRDGGEADLEKTRPDANASTNDESRSSPTPTTTTTTLTPGDNNFKIDILLKATANAPIMKKKRWSVNQEQRVGWISDFVKRYLKLDAGERLFLYVNQTFAPAPDQTVKNLYDCYGTDGKLIIHYCKSQAWG